MKRKDVQNQHCAVNDADVEYILQIADLGGREFVIKHDEIDIPVISDKFCDFLRFTRADIGFRVSRRRVLDNAGGFAAACRIQQARQFVQRRGQCTLGQSAVVERDEHGPRAPLGIHAFFFHKNTPFTNKKSSTSKKPVLLQKYKARLFEVELLLEFIYAAAQAFITEQVIPHYMRLGVGGWRLDVVDEYSGAFLEGITRAVRACDPQAPVIGEVWEDASCKVAYGERKNYFCGGRLDGVTNYPLRDALIAFLTAALRRLAVSRFGCL